MKKTALSIVAVVALSTIANATPASELAELKAQMEVMAEKVAAMEAKAAEKKEVKVVKNATQITSKSPTIEMSGTHYLGFVSSKSDVDGVAGERKNGFETRRNYIQTKAYFKENPKDYVRVTLDTYRDGSTAENGTTKGYSDVILKYAYLYLDEILPYTGVEIGQAHRPWIDYEEHGGWNYRSISKVFVEDKGHGMDWTNSADLGVNFKTKTPYFSSELGLFNGEGYHRVDDAVSADSNNNGLSAEWRLTGHILGTGKEKRKNDLQYADVSFFGQYNQDNRKGVITAGTNDDFKWYGVHAVYNQPEFLLAAQYVKADDKDAGAAYAGTGYSINGEYRITPEIIAIAKYDKVDLETKNEREGKMAGLVYQYNKNVAFIGNYQMDTAKTAAGVSTDTNYIMATAEIKW